MRKVISTTWPWDHNRFTQQDVVKMALELGANEVCIRTPEYTKSYKPEWNEDLARRLQAEEIDVSIWPVVAFRYPELEAEAIRLDVQRYLPVRIYLDAENKNWLENIPRFLEALGRQPVPVGLGSYRRADLHTEMNWYTWLTAQDGDEFIIDFLANQLYPIGWLSPGMWVADFRRAIDAWERQLALAKRPGMPWLPWMPAFIGKGYEGMDTPWVPVVDAVRAAVDYMCERLGSRLIGFNWWSLDKDLVDISELYEYIKTLPAEEQAAPRIEVSIAERIRSGVDVIDGAVQDLRQLLNESEAA
jgi:hypothetical protein